MIIMLKGYNTLVLNFLLITILLIFSFSSSIRAENIENQSYTYAQINIGVGILSNFYLSSKTYSSTDKKWITKNYNSYGYGDINPNISFGWYFVNSDMNLEFQYGKDKVFEKTLNNDAINTNNRDNANASFEYFLLNLKKNIFTFWQRNKFYLESGLGVAYVSIPSLGSEGGNKPELAINLGFGINHTINNSLDIGIAYNYKTNLAYRDIASASGAKQIYWLQQHNAVLFLKYKI